MRAYVKKFYCSSDRTTALEEGKKTNQSYNKNNQTNDLNKMRPVTISVKD